MALQEIEKKPCYKAEQMLYKWTGEVVNGHFLVDYKVWLSPIVRQPKRQRDVLNVNMKQFRALCW